MSEQNPAFIPENEENANLFSKNLEGGVDCNVRRYSTSVQSEIPCHEKSGHRRRVSEDFRAPKWLEGVTCPYQYTKTFEGKYGLVNYELTGEHNAHLVICFHGLNGSLSAFQEVQGALVHFGFQVLSFDLYGHGLSACPHYSIRGHSYTLNFFLDQTIELLEHVQLTGAPCSLLGFSMGCVISCGFARKCPEMVKRIILVAPAGMLPNKPFVVRVLRRIRCCIPFVQSCICRCCFNKDRFLQRCAKSGTDPQMAALLYNRIAWSLFVKKGSIAAALGCAAHMPLWSFEETYQQVGQFNVPVLLLWGQNDAVSPVSASSQLLDCFPNGHLIVFNGGTHLLLADKCHQINATILTFLQFPTELPLSSSRYLLPFSAQGHYVPRSKRCPDGMSYSSFISTLNLASCDEPYPGLFHQSTSKLIAMHDDLATMDHKPGACAEAVTVTQKFAESQQRPSPNLDTEGLTFKFSSPQPGESHT